MGTPFIGLSLALALICVPGVGAPAGPFDRSAISYGPALNEALERAGSGLRFDLERCGTGPQWECRFSSSRVSIIVDGGRLQTGIGKITIAADIPKDVPTALPDAVVLDALIALTATMSVLDPDLPPDRRNGMVLSLLESVHGTGYGAERGIAADYEIGLHREATTLLVITATPKP